MEKNQEIYMCVHVCVCVCVLSWVRLFETPWTVARQAPLSMGFSRPEYGGGLPSPGALPHPGMEPESPVSPALISGFFATGTICHCPDRQFSC